MKIQNQNIKNKRRIKIDVVILALICIAVGIVFIARNTGAIGQSVFNIIISWQMLLVLLGFYVISHKGYIGGVFIIGTGTFFMISLILGGEEWINTFWPVILIFIGLLLLIKAILPKKHPKKCRQSDNMITRNQTENGFINSKNTFSGTKHVIMDEVFKGADINIVLGGCVLDLRHTTIEDGDTYINIDCVLGGLEIYLLNDWLIMTDISIILGGVEDERHITINSVNENKRLILNGNITLGGVVLKN